MPSHKEFYDALNNISVNADTLNLNTDQVESKLDTTTGLLTTLSADTAIIKDKGILNGDTVAVTVNGGTVEVDGGTLSYVNGIGDGDGSTFGLDRNFPVDVQNAVTVSGTVPVSQSTASSLKGQAQILNSAGNLITYSESGTYGSPSVDVISVQNPQGTSATATTFSLTTPSSVLVSASTSRKVLTVFNAGAGILYISPTSTATTTSFQVRLASGDYWECPERQVTMAHRAVFDVAGTAYITSIS